MGDTFEHYLDLFIIWKFLNDCFDVKRFVMWWAWSSWYRAGIQMLVTPVHNQWQVTAFSYCLDIMDKPESDDGDDWLLFALKSVEYMLTCFLLQSIKCKDVAVK